MDPDTKERVVETTEEMIQDLAFLAEKQSLSKEAFMSEQTQNYAVKRALQNVINAIIDITRTRAFWLTAELRSAISLECSSLLTE